MAVEAVIFQQIVDINWDQAIYTASPNNTINVAQFAAKGSGTNIGIALTPKGTGYISAQVPDGTTVGGNARGARSVDFQMTRSTANRVASGADSAAFGSSNIVSGSHSGALASTGGQVTGTYALVFASEASSATGNYSITAGQSNQCSGEYAFCGGAFSNNQGYGSFLFGIGGQTSAAAQNSFAFGRTVRAHIRGHFVIGAEQFSSAGDNQLAHVIFSGKTTTNAEVELLVHGVDRCVVRANTSLHGRLTITGVKSDGSAVARYVRNVCVKRVTNTTSIEGTIDVVGVDQAAGTLLLVDSGGQYPDGTTDVTRTMAIGTPSREMCERFTLVLKGHLVLAALLAAAHHGIVNRLDPGPAVEGDGYAAAARDGVRLPTDWVGAVDLFERSEVLRDYLGPRFVDMFTSVKRTEQDRFGAVVTALDYDWYLGNA
jgi:hypothetical protein